MVAALAEESVASKAAASRTAFPIGPNIWFAESTSRPFCEEISPGGISFANLKKSQNDSLMTMETEEIIASGKVRLGCLTSLAMVDTFSNPVKETIINPIEPTTGPQP